jgi:glycosyltransferase involved in cell wall biosynthesis
MVVDGRTGLLVPARDAAAMGAALLALTFDPQRRAQMGEAGREVTRSTYPIERSVAALADVYRGVTATTRY